MQRRKFLQGLGGVVFALPFLESFWAETGMASENDPGRFAIFVRQANGVVQNRFWPTAFGPLTAQTLGTSLAVSTLKDYMANLTIIKGLSHAFPNDGCDHAYGGVQALTAAKPIKGSSANRTRANGESLDNLIARVLHPGVEPLTLYAGIKDNYLDEVLSYRGKEDLRGAEQSPFAVYQRMFGAPVIAGSVDPQALMRKSVNDFVRTQMKALMNSPKLSKADVERLELHQSSIRDVEKSIVKGLSEAKVAEMEKLSNNDAYSNSLEDVVKLHMDLIGIAIATGQVRSATLQIGSGGDKNLYTIDGKKVPAFHTLSHREGVATVAEAEDLHAKIDIIHGQMFKYLLDALSSYKFDNRPLLDFGASVWMNDLADGPTHGHKNVPHVIAGSCNGALKNGIFVDANTTNNQLLNSIGAACGIKNGSAPLDNFGDESLAKRVDCLDYGMKYKIFSGLHMKKLLLALAIVSTGCAKPVDRPLKKSNDSAGIKSDVSGANADANNEEDKSPPAAIPSDSGDETAVTPPPSPEKEPALTKLERIPEGCTGQGTVTAKDLVLFNGEDVKFNSSARAINISAGWRIDDSWDAGVLGVEERRNQPAITFTKEGLYHGFFISSPNVNGKWQNFSMKGVDIYYDSSKSATSTFGLRIIKPGEEENGQKRSWFKLNAAGSGNDFDADLANIESGTCKLLHFYTSKSFIDQKFVSTRFIWEMMENWTPSDKLFIYKIVIKEFELK